ncbi:hypothetical protein ACIQGZ_19680 [Streptomyces sp. NPDC092296]|uniref:hypothetical protein n=1 Tax=Streptomyces sp. NPDC092296 TaxID=3366012 RepID=UPI0038282E22
MRETTYGERRAAVRPDGLGALRLSRPAARVFPRRPPAGLTGLELQFMTDFLAAFGAEPDHERYAGGGGNRFTEMARELLDGLERPLPPLGRMLLAYHVPDMSIVDVTGCYLAERCPGRPEVFSVSGQGVGAPFTALRMLSAIRRAGSAAESAVLVLDQSTLPYLDPDTHARPISDCAVLLRSDCAGEDEGADVDFLAEQVVDPTVALRELARRRPEARIVVGRMLAERLDPGLSSDCDLVEGERDRLCTSAWAALAEHWTQDRYTVVADYDPHSGRLFQVGLRPGAAA